MKLTKGSTQTEVAICVGTALAAAGIRAVLTGGACANLYAGGRYPSADLDFVIQGLVSASEMDAAMNAAGFRRRGNQYLHPRARFYVEFPRGPLAIGDDFNVQPVEYTIRRTKLIMLSPTDSCRDRLAAFYHWRDYRSLDVAVGIARRHRLDVECIRKWSTREGHTSSFEEFMKELRKARELQRRAAKRKPSRSPARRLKV